MDETTHKEYLGDEHKYTIYFIQEGNTITGDGEKYWYNGKDLPSTSHTPISISGKCLGDSIVCKYTLKGSKRETTGNFTVYHDNGQLSGRFSGTAASSKGRVKGKKR